jgi:hypothetical protein
MQSKINIVLRNPVKKDSFLKLFVEPNDTLLAKDWVDALKNLLMSGNQIEKNYCFMGFPQTARDLKYLCDELNSAIRAINMFNYSGVWQQAGLSSYIIEDHFTPDSVRFGDEYPIGYDDRSIGLSIKHGIMNKLHNHFERLQGTVWNLSEYYCIADYETKYAIRQLNNICHEIESLCLSLRKFATAPEWIRPSQLTTFLHAPRLELKDEHRSGFATNGYDRRFGYVYLHWTQIGKTLFEVFRDEAAPQLEVGADPTDIKTCGATCEAITALKFYSGEFDIEWGRDVVMGGGMPWHDRQQVEFQSWISYNGLDYTDPRLSLGYLPLARVLLNESFSTTDHNIIWDRLSEHQDIYQIIIDDVVGTFDYCWSDSDYKQRQITAMIPGYNHSNN